MKKFVSALLLVTMLFSTAYTANAQEPTPQNTTVQLRYTGMFSYYADLRSDGNTLLISAGISPYTGYTCKATFELQEKVSGGTWKAVAKYTDTGSTSSICSIGESYTARANHSYRGYCTFQTFDASGNTVDQKSHYTTILYF